MARGKSFFTASHRARSSSSCSKSKNESAKSH
jgi:hypothetical protein